MGMMALYEHHGGEPVMVNTKMQYRPSWDSIVYVEGMRSIKVERWQIDYYTDVLRESLNVSGEYVESYFDLIRRLLEQPLFWEYFSEDVTDPTNNSINEKCARIRRAFVEAFGAYKAEPYCISGPRGEVKRIALDRQYVDWIEENN